MKNFERSAVKKRQVLESLAHLLYGDMTTQIAEIVIKPEDPYGHHWSVACRTKNLAHYFCPTCLTEFEFLRSDLVNHMPLCGYCGTALLEESIHAAR